MDLDPQSESGARNRTVIKAVVGLVAAGAVLGLLTGVLGASAMRAIGFNSSEPPHDPGMAPQSSSSPSSSPTTEQHETASSSTDQETDAKKDHTKKEKKRRKPEPGKPKLQASPSRVDPGERISLTGTFPKLDDGAVLQVQRRDGGSWEDFPVEARTDGDGTFETWVVTSRTGKMKFRLQAEDGGAKTPPATVHIG